jgi:hypothetical protein
MDLGRIRAEFSARACRARRGARESAFAGGYVLLQCDLACYLCRGLVALRQAVLDEIDALPHGQRLAAVRIWHVPRLLDSVTDEIKQWCTVSPNSVSGEQSLNPTATAGDYGVPVIDGIFLDQPLGEMPPLKGRRAEADFYDCLLRGITDRKTELMSLVCD